MQLRSLSAHARTARRSLGFTAARRLIRPAALALPVVLAACGGGNGTATDTAAPNPIPINLTACAPFIDSFGRSVTCEEMRLLPGAIWGFVEPGGNPGTGAGDAGADGTVADGGPIANTLLEFKDQRSRIVRATTDANGYFRISLRGLTPPLTASLLNYPQWQSMLVNPLVRAPANRQFYTLNLTGLTHVLATGVAKRAGLSTVQPLAPAQVAAQAAALPGLIAALNSTLSQPLALSGLGLPFNPLSTPFRADGQSGYDRVLRSTTLTRTTDGGATVSAGGGLYAKGCEVPSFTGAPAQGGGYATMNMVSDGGQCSLYLSGDPEGKVPAENGRLLTQPTRGTVVFDQSTMAYTPLYGSRGTDVFSYEMSATVNGQTVPLVVQMTIQITAPTAVP